MEVTKPVKDIEHMKKVISKTNNTYVTTARCSIEFPAWYVEKGMAIFGEEVSFFGICAIVSDGKYCTSIIPTLCKSRPVSIESVERDGELFTTLEFAAGDELFVSDQVIQETLMSYDFFNNFFLRSKVPWFIGYLDLVKALNNLIKYTGSKVGVNPLANEIIVSYLARNSKDPKEFFRQTSMNDDPIFVDLMDIFYGVSSTVNKITGGYFDDGVLGAIVEPDTNVTDMDKHLKG